MHWNSLVTKTYPLCVCVCVPPKHLNTCKNTEKFQKKKKNFYWTFYFNLNWIKSSIYCTDCGCLFLHYLFICSFFFLLSFHLNLKSFESLSQQWKEWAKKSGCQHFITNVSFSFFFLLWNTIGGEGGDMHYVCVRLQRNCLFCKIATTLSFGKCINFFLMPCDVFMECLCIKIANLLSRLATTAPVNTV